MGAIKRKGLNSQYKIEENLSDNYKFQRKRHENQFKHCVKVLSTSKEARLILKVEEETLQKVKSAKENTPEGNDLVQNW